MRTKFEALARAALLLCALQLARVALEGAAYLVVPHTLLTNELVRTGAYCVPLAAVVALARRGGVALQALPGRAGRGAGRPAGGRWVEAAAEVARAGAGACGGAAAAGQRLSGGYALALAGFGALFVATPFLTGQAGEAAAWAALVCGCLATPVFEEVLFRGYVWGRLERVFGGGRQLVAVTAVLFGLWHLGYADAVAWRIAQPDALASASLWVHLGTKALFGAGIGLVLGYLRARHGTCLAPMVFHGVWNLLA